MPPTKAIRLRKRPLDLSEHFSRPVSFAWRQYSLGGAEDHVSPGSQHVHKAIAFRQTEYVHGRATASEALRAMGCPETDVPCGCDGAPVWPHGVVGSISHCRGLCMAVVASALDFRSIGIDVERIHDVRPDLWPDICTPAELLHLQSLTPAQATRAAAVIFSAKESLYKAQWPVLGLALGFEDVEIELAGGAFSVIVPAHDRLFGSLDLERFHLFMRHIQRL